MKKQLSADHRRRVRSGPLAGYSDGFAEDLRQRGYSEYSVHQHSLLLEHLSRWMQDRSREPADLTNELADDFLDGRRRADYRRLRSTGGLMPLLRHLRGLEVIPQLPAPPPPAGAVDTLLERYRDHLVRERGLATETLGAYEAVARRFLVSRVAGETLDLSALSGVDVTRFVLDECQRCSRGSVKMSITGLRSILRFLHLSGRTAPLADAVPAIAGWRLDSLPRSLEPGQATRLLGSCHLDTAVGRRDRAMLILLIRMALRAGEVAALELDDFDWPRGEVVIRGKGDRRERLPLPVDVGQAVAAYIMDGRPRCGSRRLFMRVRAPITPATRSSVQRAVRQACDRIGIAWCGPHRLRHTAATEMVRSGASLHEVGQVLRHRSIATTAIYAKVDRVGLRTLARSWPGVPA